MKISELPDIIITGIISSWLILLIVKMVFQKLEQKVQKDLSLRKPNDKIKDSRISFPPAFFHSHGENLQ